MHLQKSWKWDPRRVEFVSSSTWWLMVWSILWASLFYKEKASSGQEMTALFGKCPHCPIFGFFHLNFNQLWTFGCHCSLLAGNSKCWGSEITWEGRHRPQSTCSWNRVSHHVNTTFQRNAADARHTPGGARRGLEKSKIKWRNFQPS